MLYSAIALATVLIAGLVSSVWFLLHRAERAGLNDKVLACVSEVGRRDPFKDAEANFYRGDRRFLLMSHNGVVATLAAEGVCEVSGMGAGGLSPFAGPDFDGIFSVKGHFCCDFDPPKTACGNAITSYFRAYNREMARLNSQNIKAYCKNGSAQR
ncbi:hypothetical protein [Novosphingobium sp.]|uniref:hypothetical protein n=1 Tax=Novosphingobium sp. TaxID=1874826 RepID=UPI0025F0A266|nr:hypothetical protein [Novosphingobium sp.]